MEDPLNPMESQDPLNNTNPMEDPLFDALERSIENPLGFADPLAENKDPLMDDLSRQLDAIEAGIENSPPIPPQPAPGEPPGEQGKDETDASQQEPSIPLPPSTPDIDKSSEDLDEEEEEPETGNLQAPGQRERFDRRPPAGPIARPPRMPYGDGWRQGGHPQVHRSRPGGRTGTGRSRGLKYCPDSRDLISEEKCDSCEKFRHWPEGTDEEPRECWYDWQLRSPSNDSE